MAAEHVGISHSCVRFHVVNEAGREMVVTGSSSDSFGPAARRVKVSVSEAVEEVRAGRFVVVVDDMGPFEEADLTIAADAVTPEAINFMARHARGLIRLSLPAQRCAQLGLQLVAMADESALMVSIDARDGVSTGISAADRARTIVVAIDPASTKDDLVRPGHIFPVCARPGGVLERVSRVEAAMDLARLAGRTPAGVICQIMDDAGTMARGDDLAAYCRRHDLKLISVGTLLAHRRTTERPVESSESVRLPTRYGDFTAIGFREPLTDHSHLALVKGDIADARDVVVGRHTQCLTGDAFRSMRCDCRVQLERSLEQIAGEGRGVLLYLARPGYGLGLLSGLKAAAVGDGCAVGVAPAKDPGADVGHQILAELGLSTIRVLPSHAAHFDRADAYGLTVTEYLRSDAA
jgi:3,4-dihydroxy 2-butanone 4-phosphate synthase/GTP cyclohydrolase II